MRQDALQRGYVDVLEHLVALPLLSIFHKKSQITHSRHKAISYNGRHDAKNKIGKIMDTPLRKGIHRTRGLCEVVDTQRLEFLCYMNGHHTAFAAISCGQF
jgi:hypothetical protein